jgi:hypothetical protein
MLAAQEPSMITPDGIAHIQLTVRDAASTASLLPVGEKVVDVRGSGRRPDEGCGGCRAWRRRGHTHSAIVASPSPVARCARATLSPRGERGRGRA